MTLIYWLEKERNENGRMTLCVLHNFFFFLNSKARPLLVFSLCAFLRCLLECSEMVWGLDPCLAWSMVIDISDGCLPPPTSHVVILDAVQGKGSILRCYLHGISIGYFISQKWNLRLSGVVQPVAQCWARGTLGLLSPSESASNSSSWQTFFFF